VADVARARAFLAFSGRLKSHRRAARQGSDDWPIVFLKWPFFGIDDGGRVQGSGEQGRPPRREIQLKPEAQAKESFQNKPEAQAKASFQNKPEAQAKESDARMTLPGNCDVRERLGVNVDSPLVDNTTWGQNDFQKIVLTLLPSGRPRHGTQ
jgi:hypothetical protein